MENHTQKDDFTPRDYQVELYQAALRENTIVYLPTGAGKTFIAVLLIRNKAEEVTKPLADGGRRTIFLTPTVVLAEQQSSYLKRHLDLNVGFYVGSMNVDFWSKLQWNLEFEKNHVLVMTPQIFSNILDHNFFHLHLVNLLIIDECHGTVKNSPMREVIKKMDQCRGDGLRPRVLGLTAALFRKRCKSHQVDQHIQLLERTMEARIRTASNMTGATEHSAKPKICLVECCVTHVDDNHQSAFEVLENVLSALLNNGLEKADRFVAAKDPKHYSDRISEPADVFKELLELLNIFGPWGAVQGAETYRKFLERQRLRAVHADYAQLVTAALENLKSIQEAYATAAAKWSEQERLKILAKPILSRLIEVLRHYQPDSTATGISLCGLVFVQRRSSATVLYHYLKAVAAAYPELSFVRPLFTVGQSGDPRIRIEEHAILEMKQREIMNWFRDGRCNLLVSTSVLEEGIDVRACNLVVRFNEVRTFCDFVQAKGRARAANAFYVVLFNEDNQDIKEISLESIKVEKVLAGKYENVSDTSAEDDWEFETEEDLIPPYMPFGPRGPRITLSNAIPLINRYCSSLPADRFVQLAPEWTILEKGVGQGLMNNKSSIPGPYQCSLLLPLNSPLREEILGLPMPNKLNAKRAAAFATCVKLHQLKQLTDDHFLPVSRDFELLHEEDVEFEEDPVEPGGFKPGTRKRVQNYRKAIASELQKGSPRPQAGCFLYEIVITKAADDSLPFTARTLGLLTTKSFPEVCPFPLYNRQGKLEVTVRLVSTELAFSSVQLQKIGAFHRYLFEEILRLTDSEIRYDPDAAVGLLVVPLRKERDIVVDFDIMDKVLHAPPLNLALKSKAARRLEIFHSSRFADAVVAALHREPVELFYVEQVTQLTPLSPFPRVEHKNFIHYYLTKYGVVIQNSVQSLLDVTRVATNASYLTPRADKDKKDFDIHLVPELCAVHCFPASLWKQVCLLPALLYRFNGLLLADSLRRRLAQEAKLGSISFHSSHSWPPAEVVYSREQLRKLQSSVYPSREATLGQSKQQKRALGPGFAIKKNIAEAVEKSVVYQSISGRVSEHLLDLGLDMTWIVDLNGVSYNDVPDAGDALVEDITFNDDSDDGFLAEHEDLPPQDPSVFSFDRQPESRNIGPSSGQILQALTAISANEDINLERLEIVGDSFLKLAVSVYLYTQRSANLNEGHLTALRIKKISNRTLYYLGKRCGLPEIIRTERFLPGTKWLPPRYSTALPEDSSRVIQEKVSDKSISDSMEALIGVYLLTTGTSGALKFIEWTGLKVVPSDGKPAQSNGFVGPRTSPIIGGGPNAAQLLERLLPNCQQFEDKINYRFKERGYLLQAISHASFYPNRVTDCYQRLEFLGDALLDYLVTRHLYEGPIKHSPGALTDLRSALVNNATFACLAVRNGFHRVLKHMSVTLARAIDVFVSKQDNNGHRVLDDYLLIEHGEDETDSAADIEIPKVLGDIFESVAGAIFLDSDLSMDAVWNVYYPLMSKEIEEFSKCIPISPVRELYELEPDRTKFRSAVVLDDDRVSVTVDIEGKGSFCGVGRNSVIAKSTAAKFALKKLKSL